MLIPVMASASAHVDPCKPSKPKPPQSQEEQREVAEHWHRWRGPANRGRLAAWSSRWMEVGLAEYCLSAVFVLSEPCSVNQESSPPEPLIRALSSASTQRAANAKFLCLSDENEEPQTSDDTGGSFGLWDAWQHAVSACDTFRPSAVFRVQPSQPHPDVSCDFIGSHVQRSGRISLCH